MSIWVLGSPHLGSANQALAAEGMGSTTQLIAARDGPNHGEMAGGRVFLASLETQADIIAAFFTAPEAKVGRKILKMSPMTANSHEPFGMSDMLIFGQTEFAAFLGLDREPDSLESLAPIQPMLTRTNQAAVVILDGIGTVAVWADRMMLSQCFTPGRISINLPADCICGTIAAAVAQGIGPEYAMTLACAAASLAQKGTIPIRTEIEAVIAAGR